MKAKKRSCNSRESKWVESPGGYSLIRAQWGRAASQGMFFGIFVPNRVSFLRQEPITLFLDDEQPALMFYECLKLGIKNRNSILNRVGKSAIFVVNRVRAGYEGQSRTSPLGHHWQLAEGSRGRQGT